MVLTGVYRAIVGFLVVLLVSCSSRAPVQDRTNQNFATVGDFGRWMMNYHKTPRPDRLKHALCDDDLLRLLKQQEKFTMFVFFAAGALETDTPAIVPTLEHVTRHCSEVGRLFLAGAFWAFQRREVPEGALRRLREGVSGTTARRIDTMRSKESPNLTQMSLRRPGQLDWLWAYYSGSGDPAMVQRVIDGVMLGYGTDNERTHEVLVSAAAARSLSFRMNRDSTVESIVEEYTGVASPDKREYLREKLGQQPR